MRIEHIAYFGLCVLFYASSSTAKLSNEDNESFTVTEDDVSVTEHVEEMAHLTRTPVTVDLTMSKMNDSEIFENGQTAKEDHQRSFVYIQNTKSRLPWMLKARSSLFKDEFSNAKNVVRGGTDAMREFKNVSKQRKNKLYKDYRPPENPKNIHNKPPNQYPPSKHPFSAKYNIKNQDGPKKWDRRPPFVPYNDRPTPVTKATPVYPYFNKGYQMPYENQQHHSIYAIPGSPTALKHDKIAEEKNRYLPHDRIINESQFNCFNKDCENRTNNYRVRMNNGVLQGVDCVCKNFPVFHNKEAQDWRARKKMTEAEKIYIRSHNTNNSDDYSYENLIKEMKKLSRIVDGLDNNARS
ncbi:uncharacterized protein LOC125232976 [Leguminivora glycinivorella]|uniref:uncharacterized protein LOC125232976 n=1 Tax=Leguminivora glycinivorella TaxID=1035111 RepID=UPI00200C107F|nr:uncharacterized protein LOC125232976 [Leguminivora glycinivorella]